MLVHLHVLIEYIILYSMHSYIFECTILRAMFFVLLYGNGHWLFVQ